ncbi:MAG: GNAT family N-acetyltransferase [Raineya sp.]|jgi:GNAT superfamily N-acetyltransferase|nr:GNAT family N-acetyltransferase [Raineya sp.]
MISIQKFDNQDIRDLAQVFDLYRIFYQKESDIKGAEQFLKARLENNESVIYIALNNEKNKIIGFVQLYPLFSSTRMQKLWLLNDLYVIETYRSKGISRMLIDVSKNLCKDTNACGLMLETAKDNIIGNQLYPATDFVLDKEHNFYFWDNL